MIFEMSSPIRFGVNRRLVLSPVNAMDSGGSCPFPLALAFDFSFLLRLVQGDEFVVVARIGRRTPSAPHRPSLCAAHCVGQVIETGAARAPPPVPPGL
jgi:hypothetical protein